MTIEQAKQAIKVCPEHYCTSCPVEEIPYECTCDDVVTILKDLVGEYEERIAIMQESMETLEKRCNALEALEQRCKTLEKRLDDSDRINVVRCSECQYWNPPTYAEQEDGSTIGHCTAALNGQQTDACWFCADGTR